MNHPQRSRRARSALSADGRVSGGAAPPELIVRGQVVPIAAGMFHQRREVDPLRPPGSAVTRPSARGTLANDTHLDLRGQSRRLGRPFEELLSFNVSEGSWRLVASTYAARSLAVVVTVLRHERLRGKG